jgi:hypothetical protein
MRQFSFLAAECENRDEGEEHDEHGEEDGAADQAAGADDDFGGVAGN